jgi:hypothetical protein
MAQLTKWNVSAAPPSGPSSVPIVEEEGQTRYTKPSPAERYANNQEEPDTETRHGRRLKPGEKGESRSFDAVRRSSGDGDFSLNRNARQGSKKGKEREFEGMRSASVPRKGDKLKKPTSQKTKAAEKEVYIPSTVTVSRLADIFGVKICECLVADGIRSGLTM